MHTWNDILGRGHRPWGKEAVITLFIQQISIQHLCARCCARLDWGYSGEKSKPSLPSHGFKAYIHEKNEVFSQPTRGSGFFLDVKSAG